MSFPKATASPVVDVHQLKPDSNQRIGTCNATQYNALRNFKVVLSIGNHRGYERTSTHSDMFSAGSAQANLPSFASILS